MKTDHLSAVIGALRPFVEPDAVPAEDAPVRQCYRYIINRPGQFRYAQTIVANLPIGSGEVESAHRYVIQKRLKLAGAWWRKDNDQAMLNLRTARANRCWGHSLLGLPRRLTAVQQFQLHPTATYPVSTTYFGVIIVVQFIFQLPVLDRSVWPGLQDDYFRVALAHTTRLEV